MIDTTWWEQQDAAHGATLAATHAVDGNEVWVIEVRA